MSLKLGLLVTFSHEGEKMTEGDGFGGRKPQGCRLLSASFPRGQDTNVTSRCGCLPGVTSFGATCRVSLPPGLCVPFLCSVWNAGVSNEFGPRKGEQTSSPTPTPPGPLRPGLQLQSAAKCKSRHQPCVLCRSGKGGGYGFCSRVLNVKASLSARSQSRCAPGTHSLGLWLPHLDSSWETFAKGRMQFAASGRKLVLFQG